MNMKTRILGAALVVVLTAGKAAVAQVALGSEFTYQGQLRIGGTLVNDTADFEFTLWDADSAGNLIGGVVTANNVDVVDGVFTVDLDFGVMAFNGDARWLEVDVRSPAGIGGFTTLEPRQPLSAAPYALQTRGLHVDDLQRVGIGNTSPQHPLSIGEPTADVGAVLARIYSTGTGQWNGNVAIGGADSSVILGELLGVATIGGHNGTLSAWSDLALNTYGGNVSIGDTPATDRLTVAGRIKSTTGGFVFPDGSIQSTAAMTTPSPWQSVIGGISYNAGHVGIGMPEPRYSLHVEGDLYAKGHFLLHAYEGDHLDGTAYIQARDDSATTSIGLQLRTQSQGTIVDVVNMTPAGTVGIGTPGATDKLTVAGTIKSQAGGFVFPDGTTQTTAAMTATSLWQTTAEGIQYDAGNVAIGTTDTSLPFRVAGAGVGPNSVDQQSVLNGICNTFTDSEQEFVPGVTGYLTSVVTWIFSNSGVDRIASLQLIEGGHNQPGAVLAVGNIWVGSGNSAVTFDFSAAPPHLVAGQTYRLVVQATSGSVGPTCENNPYPAGGAWFNGAPSSSDTPFATYMAPEIPGLSDRIVVNDIGRVGIGTGLPYATLDVNGDARVATSITAGTSISAGSAISAGASISAGTSMTTPTLYITGGSDIAEPYDIIATRGEAPMPGFVVSIDPDHIGKLRVACNAYDATVAGIISGAGGVNPGLTLTQTGSVAQGEHPVAMNGRVWCFVDADAGGAVRAGDLLTTSSTPGHAMRVGDTMRSQGAIIGKAMSSLESGRGLVLVLVSLQ